MRFCRYALASLLLLLSATGYAAAAVSFDAKGTSLYTASGTSASYTGITVGAGSNRALAVTISFGGALPTGLTVTWDSGGSNQAMSPIITATSGINQTGYIFCLANPTSGNKTLALAWTGAAETMVEAISFTGANQGGGTTTCPNSQGVNGTTSLNIVSSVGDMVIASETTTGSLGTLTGTQLFLDNTHGAIINAAANCAGNGLVCQTTASSPVAIGTTSSLLLVATDIAAAGGGTTKSGGNSMSLTGAGQ